MSEIGYAAEVFDSIQGEGLFVGVHQVFVRLAGCRLSCDYCDTPDARESAVLCTVTGGGGEVTLDNPVTAAVLAGHAVRLARSTPCVHSVSITGGEPLEQPEFVHELCGLIRAGDLSVYLETNGLHPEAASLVAPLVDYVSLDIKLPSLCRSDVDLESYRAILRIFAGAMLFCKVVIAKGFERDELIRAADIISSVDRTIPVVIQPATPTGSDGPVDGGTLVGCSIEIAGHLDDVRVIPQCHKLLGVR